MHAGGCGHYGGEKRNVLIVLILRCPAQQDVKAHRGPADAVLIHVATAPKAVVGHGQVEDQAPAARCVLEVVADLDVSAPLALPAL